MSITKRVGGPVDCAIRDSRQQGREYLKHPIDPDLIAIACTVDEGASEITVTVPESQWDVNKSALMTVIDDDRIYVGTVRDGKYFVLVSWAGAASSRSLTCTLFQLKKPGSEPYQEVGSWTAQEV